MAGWAAWGGGGAPDTPTRSPASTAPSPWGDSNEFKLLSDASFEDMASALRRRVASWAAKNRLAFALLVCALSSLLFLGGSRGLGAWRRRRQRKAMAAETAAAAEAFLARPDSPEAINAFTAALAQPLGSVGAATVNPEAIRRLSVALAADGSDLPSILRDGPLHFRRVDSSASDDLAAHANGSSGPGGIGGIGGMGGMGGSRAGVGAFGGAASPPRQDDQCRLGRRTLGHGRAGARATPAATPTPVPPRPPRADLPHATEFLQGVRLGKEASAACTVPALLDGAEYAVKKVLLTGSSREQERAVREAGLMAKLDHHNIVRYYQVWKEDVDEEGVLEFEDSESEEDLEGSESVEPDESSSYGYSRSRRRSMR